MGGPNVGAEGTGSGYPCAAVYIVGNLITAYANHHYRDGEDHDARFADGIGTACEHTTAEHNQIVDPTDTGVVVFKCGWRDVVTCTQQSIVRYNTVLNAGNSAAGTYGINHLFEAYDYSFAGMTIEHNVLWTSRSAHVDVPLFVGTRAWFPTGGRAWHPAFRFNTTADDSSPTALQVLRSNSPILVSGAFEVIVEGNDLNVEVAKVDFCPVPSVPTATSILATFPEAASFCTKTTCPPVPLYEDVPTTTVDYCIYHHYYPVFLPIVMRGYEESGSSLLAPLMPRDYPLPMSAPDVWDSYPAP